MWEWALNADAVKWSRTTALAFGLTPEKAPRKSERGLGARRRRRVFTQVMKVQPKPIEKQLASKIVSVTVEGDLVTVAWPREYKDPKDPSKNYTTTWVDMWRIKDGKADEHWDSAMKNP